MSHHRRRRRLRRLLTIAGGVSVGALLLLSGGGQNAYSRGQLFSAPLPHVRFPLVADSPAPPPFPFAADFSPSPQPSFRLSDDNLARRLLPLRHGANHSPPQQDADAVLLSDQKVLLLEGAEPTGDAICSFQGGMSSPARPLGRLPGSGLHAYLCPVPEPAQRLQQLQAPLLITSKLQAADFAAPTPARTLLNWSDPIVFDSALLDGGDVLVFAKGFNSRQDLQCLYRYNDGDETMLASLPAISSVQQVTRCPNPPTPIKSANTKVLVTLVVAGEEPMPSLATLHRQHPDSSSLTVTPPKSSICACTMVRDVSKFLREWAIYHSAIGVDHFFIYDNASEDDLAEQVAQLKSAGLNITTVPWPWTKTQEAGLSHCAATQQGSCQWMAVIDVDEFIFSTNWKGLEKPSKSLLEAVVSVNDTIGQLYLGCLDFGPSGQTTHPPEGVCQGYTCRLKSMQRHKSLVRLDAVEPSMFNAVHHFKLKPAFQSMWSMLARVNHYKYQAWSEFKAKFKRRVSAYVADWRDPVNLKSLDRAPGLGVDAIEPEGWAEKFCEVKDTILQELTARWFGIGFGNHH